MNRRRVGGIAALAIALGAVVAGCTPHVEPGPAPKPEVTCLSLDCPGQPGDATASSINEGSQQ